ncbi:hypothetical protein O7U_00833, partial [Bartonella quintana JK 68]
RLRALSGVFGVQSIRSGSHPYASGYEAAIFDLGETKKVAGPQFYGHLEYGKSWINIQWADRACKVNSCYKLWRAPELSVSIGTGSGYGSSFAAVSVGVSAGVAPDLSTWVGAEQSVALGSGSRTRPREHARGWDPRINGSNSNDNNPWWVSSWGEVSIGNVDLHKTRHIAGVAAGWEDTDAVNVAQLKALREWAEGRPWLAYYDEGSKVIRIGSKRSGDKIDIKNSDGQDRVLA